MLVLRVGNGRRSTTWAVKEVPFPGERSGVLLRSSNVEENNPKASLSSLWRPDKDFEYLT